MSEASADKVKNALMVEGGDFQCGLHDYTTKSKQEFDEHCSGEGHYHQGTGQCILCKKAVFNTATERIPHLSFGQTLGVLCDDCKPIMFPNLAKLAQFKKTAEKPKTQLSDLTPEEQLELNQQIYGVTPNSTKFTRKDKEQPAK